MPPDCFERVISQRGEMTIYQRSSTPRLASRIVFERLGVSSSNSSSEKPRETAGGTLSEAPRLDNAAKEECSFQVDLRVQGVSQDDICKDEEWMIEMQNLFDRLQDGYRDKSFIKDMKQEGAPNVLSEESKRKPKEMDNIEQIFALEIPRNLFHSRITMLYLHSPVSRKRNQQLPKITLSVLFLLSPTVQLEDVSLHHDLWQTTHQLLKTACEQSSSSCSSLLVGFSGSLQM